MKHERKNKQQWLLTSYLYFSPALAFFNLSRASWRPFLDFFARRDRETAKLPESDTAENKAKFTQGITKLSAISSQNQRNISSQQQYAILVLYKWVLFINVNKQSTKFKAESAAPVPLQRGSKKMQLTRFLFVPRILASAT